ncbi:uncharacterized protein LOC128248688 [Octopus bimaculoides]|uniref:uncharacterized protein LOC128248688 n=1 Tax=Octopus bimaculoides TaxID=37653 RepID=UPI0022E10FDD|nr:uncharacterized protein LOC128248688 [Octopus bimaculoides]
MFPQRLQFLLWRRPDKEKITMPANRPASPARKPLPALALPGMYLVYKYNEYKRQRQEQHRRKVTERELDHLNHKIDKLLSKIDERDLETAIKEEEECVICLGAKATMQTFPCGHRVVCRKCFIKTIQVAVSQRCLPLRCVICRTRILKLRQNPKPHSDKREASGGSKHEKSDGKSTSHKDRKSGKSALEKSVKSEGKSKY